MEYKYPSSLFKEKYEIAKNIRKDMLDIGLKIVERNLRKFKKATSFPYFFHESRKRLENEVWYYYVVAESKSRLSKGIVGIFAVKLEYGEGPDKALSELLIVEGSDYNSVRFELYDGKIFDTYRKINNISSDVSDISVVSRFCKENYIAQKIYSEYKHVAIVLEDKSLESGEFIVVPHIQANSVGVCEGICNQDETGFLYLEYFKTSDYYKDRPEKLERLSDNIIDQYLELNKLPWGVSAVKEI